MRVLFWNIWGWRYPAELSTYLREALDTHDIICLTEVTSLAGSASTERPAVYTSDRAGEPPSYLNALQQIKALLVPGRHSHIYAAGAAETWPCRQEDVTFAGVRFGDVMLLNTTKATVVWAYEFDFEVQDVRARKLQCVVVEHNACRYLIAHMHGIWLAGNTKGDAPERLLQSQFISNQLQYVARLCNVQKIVMGGDLNLDIDTNALRLLERGGKQRALPLRNLIREHEITDTRTTSYRKYELPEESKHADYVLYTAAVTVTDFIVDNRVIWSDHAPLTVSFT